MFTGFILTDTYRLASKMGEPSGVIKDIISDYINRCSSYINWILVDSGAEMYSDLDKNDWKSYASILNDYYAGMGLEGAYHCPLFIIGSDDDIPMPRVDSPLVSIGREYLCSDMLYCYASHGNYNEVNLVADTPRFAVGRLPIADEYDAEWFRLYLEDCVRFVNTGLPVRGAAMTTTQSWLRASNEMMKDIPTVTLSEEYVPLNNRMVVSPDLDTYYQDMYDGYVHELKKIDMLVCNLHGSDELEEPYFLGEDVDHTRSTIATQPSMLADATPYIFNTVACFGGRYINYQVSESMLLSAMAYGTMLYCGSCEIALGGDNMEGNSELMMKLYNIYLFQGMPAGMALIKAKQDYYNTCHDEDGDENALFTILEFNLFGCPLLAMQPQLPNNYAPSLLGHQIARTKSGSYQPKTIEVITGDAHSADDIHAYLRGLVDNNLAIIRQKVEEAVYQRLGLGRENLQQVARITRYHHEIGYRFLYRWTPQQSYRHFEMYYIVQTDNNGQITKIIHTK